jgi:hypothetical protein
VATDTWVLLCSLEIKSALLKKYLLFTETDKVFDNFFKISFSSFFPLFLYISYQEKIISVQEKGTTGKREYS